MPRVFLRYLQRHWKRHFPPIKGSTIFSFVKQYFTGILLFLSFSAAFGQREYIEVSGQVLNRETFKPISLVNVINLRDRSGTVTNMEGKFKVKVRRSDTLILSSVEFVRDTITFGHITSKEHFVQVMLTSRTYVLREVEVEGLGNYDQLKAKILEWERNKKSTKRAFVERPTQPRMEAPEKVAATWTSPFDMLYETFGKRPKQLKKLAELERQDAYKAAIQYRFTPEVVNALTQLDGAPLESFMRRCRFSYEFIFTATDYEFYIAILDYYSAYRRDVERVGEYGY